MISDMEEIRADGKIVPESMTFSQMRALGWEPCIISLARWNHDGSPVEIRHPTGLLIKVLPCREFLAALLTVDQAVGTYKLCVFNADGSLRHTITNVQQVRGAAESGLFRGFERLDGAPPDLIGVVFEVDRNNATYQMTVNARTGQIVGSSQLS